MFLSEVAGELRRERADNKDFNSAHEGYAVILEKVDKLWDEVKLKRSERSKQRMRKEARQIAAMAVRFIEDLCE